MLVLYSMEGTVGLVPGQGRVKPAKKKFSKHVHKQIFFIPSLSLLSQWYHCSQYSFLNKGVKDNVCVHEYNRGLYYSLWGLQALGIIS